MQKPPLPAIQHKIDLRPYTTFGVAAQAAQLVRIAQPEALLALWARGELAPDRNWLVLGGGSNLLFTEDYQGLVLQIAIPGRSILREDEDHLWLALGAGEAWHPVVQYTVSQGWGGLENLSLIPGTVGAAPIQNIGAYGVELAEGFDHLTALDTHTGEWVQMDRPACAFGYRMSRFKGEDRGRYIITEVVLRLTKRHHRLHTEYGSLHQELQEMGQGISPATISQAVVAIRQRKLPDPAQIGNAGSFFKNPIVPQTQYTRLKARFQDLPAWPVAEGAIKLAAGWLIDQAGWKGHRQGDAGVHAQQALVLVNHGQATGPEMWALAQAIQADIQTKFGVLLEPEVNLMQASGRLQP